MLDQVVYQFYVVNCARFVVHVHKTRKHGFFVALGNKIVNVDMPVGGNVCQPNFVPLACKLVDSVVHCRMFGSGHNDISAFGTQTAVYGYVVRFGSAGRKVDFRRILRAEKFGDFSPRSRHLVGNVQTERASG